MESFLTPFFLSGPMNVQEIWAVFKNISLVITSTVTTLVQVTISSCHPSLLPGLPVSTFAYLQSLY